MSVIKPKDVFMHFSDTCSSCYLCSVSCSLLQSTELSPKELASRLMEGDTSYELVDIVQHCSLCGLCHESCPVGLNVAELMQAARIQLVNSGAIESSDYQLMLVDQKNNFFNLYRDTWDISYDDLKMRSAPVVFFPGCSLSSYAPELTRAAYQWISDHQDTEVGFSGACCGLPLLNIGLSQRSEVHLNELEQQFLNDGVRDVVTACPNCFYFMRQQFSVIKVRSIYQMMSEAGLEIAESSTISVHDSCPDRFSGEIGQVIREMLPGDSLVELPYSGQKTRCCGAGGIVSMVDPDTSASRAQERIEEILETDSQSCISACMACVKRLTSAENLQQQKEGPNAQKHYKVKHVLELALSCSLDHENIDNRLMEMWQGELGERNLELINATEHIQPDQLTKEAS